VILAAVDNSPMADLVSEAAARLATADGRAVYVVHAQEDVTASDVATDGEDLEDARALVRNCGGTLTPRSSSSIRTRPS
jgi:nucleotide-binding universal stress UspA family protein